MLTKPSNQLIVVAMEQRCLDPSSWPESMRSRLVQMDTIKGSAEKPINTLASVSAIDYTHDNDPAEIANEIYKRFKQSIPSTVTELLDEEILQELNSVVVSPQQIAGVYRVEKLLAR
jgi:hypothetical protein